MNNEALSREELIGRARKLRDREHKASTHVDEKIAARDKYYATCDIINDLFSNV